MIYGSRSHTQLSPGLIAVESAGLISIETHSLSSKDSSTLHLLPETLVCFLRLDL
jgi:hypothetical protein